MGRVIAFYGAFLGLSGVIAGALFDHALAEHMTRGVDVALRYHQLYAVLITALGLFLMTNNDALHPKWLKISALSFMGGITLFCAGLYTATITGLYVFNFIVPAGGLLLMAGWVALACGIFLHKR